MFTKEVNVVKGDLSKAVLRGPNMHLGRRTDRFFLAFSQVLTFTAGLYETPGLLLVTVLRCRLCALKSIQYNMIHCGTAQYRDGHL